MRHVRLQPVGWMGGTEGCGGDSRWEEKEVLRMGQQRRGNGVTQSLCWRQSSAIPPAARPPSRDPRASEDHNRFIVGNKHLDALPGHSRSGVGWRLGGGKAGAEVQAWSPGLWAPSCLSGSEVSVHLGVGHRKGGFWRNSALGRRGGTAQPGAW